MGTSVQMDTYEVPYLLPYVSTGQVNLVVEMIGANDFNDGEYNTIYRMPPINLIIR